MPGIKEMTATILNGMPNAWGQSIHIPSECDGLAFCKQIEEFIGEFRSKDGDKRPTNYEDIYYVITQINDHETGNYDNPALDPLIEKIKKPTEQTAVWEKRFGERWLIPVSRDACNYINKSVWNMLNRSITSTSHLECIAEFCEEYPNACIVTLNHDIVLESFLDSRGISYNDGFNLIDGEPCFDPASLNLKRGILLLKLHGSISWFRRQPRYESDEESEMRTPPRETIFKARNGSNFGYTKNAKGEDQYLIDGSPLLMIGNHNKIQEYTSYFYSHLYCAFHAALERSDKLVVCGYGFGDKGINTRIVEWRHQGGKKVVVIHEEPDKLFTDCRKAVLGLHNDPGVRTILSFMKKNLTWQSVEEELAKA